MLTTRFCVGGSVHIRQEWYISNPQAVGDNVAVNVARMIMTIGMSADNSLMSCEMFAAKLLAESLCAVNCQAVLNTITRVKTDYVVVAFDIAPIVVFAVMQI